MPSQLFEGLGLASGFTGDDPIKPYYGKPTGKYDKVADIRDYLANMVGYGSTTMTDDVKNDYGRLIGMYGKPIADKILNHVFVFNNRPDLKKASPQERLSAFYEMGSDDKDLSSLFSQARSFGKGPLAALNESVNVGSQDLSGRIPRRRGLPVPAMAPGIAQALK